MHQGDAFDEGRLQTLTGWLQQGAFPDCAFLLEFGVIFSAALLLRARLLDTLEDAAASQPSQVCSQVCTFPNIAV